MEVALTTSEEKWIADPLLKNGLSPYQIIQAHPEINISVRTLYNYIEDDRSTMRAGQKGSLENNHIELRYIFPKGANLYSRGLTRQDSLNLVLSHINSAPTKKVE